MRYFKKGTKIIVTNDPAQIEALLSDSFEEMTEEAYQALQAQLVQ